MAVAFAAAAFGAWFAWAGDLPLIVGAVIGGAVGVLIGRAEIPEL